MYSGRDKDINGSPEIGQVAGEMYRIASLYGFALPERPAITKSTNGSAAKASSATADSTAPSVMPYKAPRRTFRPASFTLLWRRGQNGFMSLTFSSFGCEIALPDRDILIHLHPTGVIPLLMVPLLIGGFLAIPSTHPISKAIRVTLSRGGQAAVGCFQGLHQKYIAPFFATGTIYDDSLRPDWMVRSTADQQVTLHATSQMIGHYKGKHAIRFRAIKPLDGLRLRSLPKKGIPLHGTSRLRIAINGGLLGGQRVHLRTEIDGKIARTVDIGPLQPSHWERVQVSLAPPHGKSGQLTGITLFADHPEPLLYLDDVAVE